MKTFIANLHAVLDHPHIAGRPDLRIILITPPPVDERMLRIADSDIPDFNSLRRTAETTARYAEAVRQVGKERNVVGEKAVASHWLAAKTQLRMQ